MKTGLISGARLRIPHGAVMGLMAGLLLATFNASATVLDFGIDPAHLGKGDWLYIMSSATAQLGGNVPSVTDVTSLMAYEKSQGMNFIVVKAGEGSTNFPTTGSPQFTPSLVTSAHAAGLKIFGYTRSYGTDIPGEINLVTNVLSMGADGYVIDAEAEWESGHMGASGASNAVALLAPIRAAYPTRFLAHSPFMYIHFHSSFPYIQFGIFCDAVMPQNYWTSFSITPIQCVADMNNDWNNWQNALTGTNRNAIKPIVPIGQGWSPATNMVTTGAQITQFSLSLSTNTPPASIGGYNGVLYFRGELHSTDMWGGIKSVTYPVSFSSQPTNQNVIAGTNVSFTALGVGTPPPTYQWRLNATNISGATNSTYAISNVQTAQAGNYTLFISNSVNSLTSSVAVLSVVGPPVVSVQPQSQAATQGSNVLFTITASGTNITYQWQFNAAAISGATKSSYQLFNAQGTNAGAYSVLMTNIYGSTLSSNATLAIAGGISFNNTLPPTVLAPIYGPEPSDPILAKTGDTSSGLPTGTQTYSGAALTGSNYTAQLWAALGSNQPEAALTLVPNATTIFKPTLGGFKVLSPVPVIPDAVEGQVATLEVRVWDNQTNTITAWAAVLANTNVSRGVSPLFNSAPLGGVTAAPPLTGMPSFNIHLPAIAPAITNQPVGLSVKRGSNAVFTVGASGTAPLGYQWRVNGSNLPGATTTSFAVLNAQTGNAGSYSVIVTNSAGTNTSSNAVLIVTLPTAPHIDQFSITSGGQLQMDLTGDVGTTYVILDSSNLVNWVPIATNTNTTGTILFSSPDTNNPYTFYRLQVAP